MAIVGCGAEPRGGISGGEQPVDGVPPDFERVTPEQLRPSIDSATAACEGREIALMTEVVGRAASLTVLVFDPSASGPAEVELDRKEVTEGSLWQRYEGRVAAPGATCVKENLTIARLARDAAGEVVDCIVSGPDARAIVEGTYAAGNTGEGRPGAVQLGSLADESYSACRIR
jgi:hypothetical protein